MTQRALFPPLAPLGLACLLGLAAVAWPLASHAQGLRPSGQGLSGVGGASGQGAGGPRLSTSGVQMLGASASADDAQASLALRQADYIVAVVDAEPITNNEVRRRAARIARQLAADGTPVPERSVLLKEVLEQMVLEKVQVQLAQESGMRVDDFAVDQAEESVARQNHVTLDELHRRMEQDGVSRQRLRTELREQLLMLRVRERDVESRVKVSELEIDQFLLERQPQAGSAGSVGAPALELNLGHILIQVPENASEAEVAQRSERAQNVLQQAQGGADWAALAQQFSDGPEAGSGGVMGLRAAQRYPSLFADATAQASVGQVVGPLRSPAGFHVLKVVDKVQGGLTSVALQNHARHILLRTHPGLSESQAAAQLAELRQRVVRGQATFAELAREYSQDGSAPEGGDLGWAGPGRYVPEFEAALATLQPGEISQPVVSRFGVHLILLEARREQHLSQREQRDMVRDQVREKKLGEAYATWMQEARGRAYVEYREPPQ